jgi:maltooligosyltrehalose trehalohydrolase
MTWQPSIGVWLEDDGARFRVWTPASQTVDVEIVLPGGASRFVPLLRADDGAFSAHVEVVGPGTRYRYRLNGRHSFPDVASRYQPDGVHGSSEIVDPSAFAWSDHEWTGIDLRDVIVYELHVGTFTPQGTFDGVRERLVELRDLGVTAIELMPIGDFPGGRNWGYDGVSLFAPARCYGRPDDLRRLVDSAHQHGLAVFLDVVYNHLGPDGNYLGAFSPYYFTERHQTPWGQALNFDGEYSQRVRDFFIENALHWLHDFHFDGLRLDATHAIADDSPRHFLAELSGRVQESFADAKRRPLLIAEDSRNLASMVKPPEEDGWGMDAVWADDFHHQVRVALVGDRDGYFRDYQGSAEEIAATVRHGWFYCGQHSVYLNRRRGSNPEDMEPSQFVICVQNHDQIGNRAFGDRLNHQIDQPEYHAAAALLLCSPQTPLLFMGQEWAASAPFQFFTNHNEELGKLVTEGRRREFQRFKAFADPATRETIPDPQALETFLNSRLQWEERDAVEHATTLRLYRDLLRLRRSEPALGFRPPDELDPGSDAGEQATGENAAGENAASPAAGDAAEAGTAAANVVEGDAVGTDTAATGTAATDAAAADAAEDAEAPYTVTADARAFGDNAVLVRRPSPLPDAGGHGDVLLVVQLRDKGTVELSRAPMALLRPGLAWRLLFSTEGSQYSTDPRPIRLGGDGAAPRILFLRAGAVLLKATRVSSPGNPQL